MYEEEFNQINAVCDQVRRTRTPRSCSSSTRTASSSPPAAQTDNIDTTTLASLTAGNIAATGGMAKLIGENEFANQFHEGERATLHIPSSAAASSWWSSSRAAPRLGLVRLRVKKATEELAKIFEALLKKAESPGADVALRRDHRRRHRQPVQRVNEDKPMSFINYIPRDQLQDRLLRARPLREDHQPAVHLQQDQSRGEGQDDLARHRDRAHAVLRLPARCRSARFAASRPASTSTRCPARSSTTPAASSSSRAWTASSSSPTSRSSAWRRTSSRSRTSTSTSPSRATTSTRSLRRPVQQARPAQRRGRGGAPGHPEHPQRARVRGRRAHRRRRVRHAEGSGEAGADGAEEGRLSWIWRARRAS